MTIILYFLTALVRWIRLKIYQYEVTFAIYMLTPTEKIIFSAWSFSPPSHPSGNANGSKKDSLILTLITMIATGIYIYLPDHLRSIYGHLYYYWAGERPLMTTRFASINSVFGETATQSLKVVYETAKNVAAAAAANTAPAEHLVADEL
ncbi:hypothetical protein N7510_005884 [Penicillium lagena]|uniref:uncharacterized protein n=1 Tax=Penicillium lagena TaxID=94218 RepID=UPI002540FAC7|nr:uncharacterized protein N7510_005884 [Penicillium lagena]KAJ5612690.1 hypothetical protein N7510_005884 [Penicillium lagena]